MNREDFEKVYQAVSTINLDINMVCNHNKRITKLEISTDTNDIWVNYGSYNAWHSENSFIFDSISEYIVYLAEEILLNFDCKKKLTKRLKKLIKIHTVDE